MAKKERPRTQRRRDERSARDLVRDKEKLARMERGGSPERPIEVDTSSVIDGRARSTPCPLCEGSLIWNEQTAERIGGEILRAVHLVCARCHAPRTFWYRIVTTGPN